MSKTIQVKTVLRLTPKETQALRACIAGELDNDDGSGDAYMRALRRIAKKLG